MLAGWSMDSPEVMIVMDPLIAGWLLHTNLTSHHLQPMEWNMPLGYFLNYLAFQLESLLVGFEIYDISDKFFTLF